MVNLMDTAYAAVMAVVARCLSTGGMLAAKLSRAVGLARRRAGAGRSASDSRAQLVWQQLFDPAVQLRQQLGKHVFQIRPGDGGKTPGPDLQKCTAYRQAGPGGLPLALCLSEGLGVAARCTAYAWWVAPPRTGDECSEDCVNQREDPQRSLVVEQALNPVLNESALVAYLASSLP